MIFGSSLSLLTRFAVFGGIRPCSLLQVGLWSTPSSGGGFLGQHRHVI